ncbi:MAG: hypothetical protein ACQEWV_32870 [Bacillota bacterium]
MVRFIIYTGFYTFVLQFHSNLLGQFPIQTVTTIRYIISIIRLLGFDPMNNFIPVPVYPVYNGWTYSAENYPVQQTPETMYRQTTRDQEFNPNAAQSAAHGKGFKLYTWTFTLNPNEYLVCRLLGKTNERVMSGGFATGKIADVYAVENFPRYPYGWVITLKNNSGSSQTLYLYLIVKE